jgi:hypothetical protein
MSDANRALAGHAMRTFGASGAHGEGRRSLKFDVAGSDIRKVRGRVPFKEVIAPAARG